MFKFEYGFVEGMKSLLLSTHPKYGYTLMAMDSCHLVDLISMWSRDSFDLNITHPSSAL